MIVTETVAISVISTIGVMAGAIVPVWITNRRRTEEVGEKANEINAKIGEPNGHGSLTNMIEKILGLVEDQAHRTSTIEHRLERLEGVIDELN